MTTTTKKTDALFLWIEERERAQAAPWGRVLDAGTGRHSLAWLTGLARALDAQKSDQKSDAKPTISSMVAVTGEPTLAAALEREFPLPGGVDALRVVAGNWQDAAFLADEPLFDVVIADYLIGAVEGFAPFYQEQVTDRLRRLLKPGGRMYMIGLQPLSESSPPADASETETRAGSLLQEMACTRDACILLAGRRCYREFPMRWYEHQLRVAGLSERASVRMANVYGRDTVQRQTKVARNQLALVRDQALARALENEIDNLDERVAECVGSGKVRFGFDFVIAAERPE